MRKLFLKQYNLHVQLKWKIKILFQEKEETASEFVMNFPCIASSDQFHYSHHTTCTAPSHLPKPRIF